jgi:hypothetical protein
LRAQIACSIASSTKFVRVELDTRHPTLRLAKYIGNKRNIDKAAPGRHFHGAGQMKARILAGNQ